MNCSIKKACDRNGWKYVEINGVIMVAPPEKSLSKLSSTNPDPQVTFEISLIEIRTKWSKLNIWDKFLLNGKLMQKINDDGYLFGILNSICLKTLKKHWVDPYSNVFKMRKN